MKLRSRLAAVASVLLLAATALAGGIDFEVKPSSETYARDADGKVALELTLENRGGCWASVLLQADPSRSGPLVDLERQDGEKWVAVEKPWDEMKPRGQLLKDDVPFRVDEGTTMTVKRTGALALGTYRAGVRAIIARGTKQESTFTFFSKAFVVADEKKAP